MASDCKLSTLLAPVLTSDALAPVKE